MTRAFQARALYTPLTLVWILCCIAPVLAQESAGPEATASVSDEKETELDLDQTVEGFVNRKDSDETGSGVEDLGVMSVMTMLFWVVVLVVAIYGVAKLLKRYVPSARNMFGSGTLKVVSRTFLSPKQSILLVKVGRRMVVVGVTPTGMSALAEIRDADELEEINREIAGSGKTPRTNEFQESLKEASRELESGQDIMTSTSSGVQEAGKGRADDGQQTELVNGIRSELDSISRKINLWRKASD